VGILSGMVQLKDFVRDSLVQIVEGVKEAGQVARKHGATINPADVQHRRDMFVTKDIVERLIQRVEFDVAVVAQEGSAMEGKAGVLAAVVGAGFAAKTEEQAQNVSRIKFAVPLVLPLGEAVTVD
jgi:hypothetical protein